MRKIEGEYVTKEKTSTKDIVVWVVLFLIWAVCVTWLFASGCAMFPETTAQLEKSKEVLPKGVDKKAASEVQSGRQKALKAIDKL